MKIDQKEVLRYLGYGKQKPDQAVHQMIDECIIALKEAVSPKFVYSIFDLQLKNNVLIFAGMDVDSQNLRKNLMGCKKIAVFGATLGIQIDYLIKKFSRLQMSKTVVLQAVATAMIEEYCDLCQEDIREMARKEGLYLRPRFSPGYGDFALEYQKDIIRVLDCAKKIGLTLTDSLIMIPSKSVTAVIGLSATEENCHKKGCESCEKADCKFRRQP